MLCCTKEGDYTLTGEHYEENIKRNCERSQKKTQVIRDNAECQLDYGTIRTLKMI